MHGQNHIKFQWLTLYSPFLFVFAVYFYAMATIHLHGCPVRLHCLLVSMCEETPKWILLFHVNMCLCISKHFRIQWQVMLVRVAKGNLGCILWYC